MLTTNRLVLFFASTIFLFSVTACESEGPMEKAGKKADKVIEDAEENLEEAGDKLKETFK